MFEDSKPNETRQRSYAGGYMAAGAKAESVVFSWLKKQGWVRQIEDVRGDKTWQERGVDFRVMSVNDLPSWVEIKSDQHLGNSGNFLFEIMRINHTAPVESAATLGWSLRSAAHVLMWYAPSSGAIHQIRMGDFRRAFQEATSDLRKSTRIVFVPTDAIKSTLNVLIPEEYVTRQPSYRCHQVPNAL